MSGLLSYSGITTKVRAMSGRLISPAQYEQLANWSTVSEALNWLKQLPAYSEVLKGFDEGTANRASIETTLSNSLYQDFSRLYRFANGEQRDFMDLYFLHYEINYLKDCLRSAYAGSILPIPFPIFEDFFSKHSRLPVQQLALSRNLEEFLQALHGTSFQAPMEQIWRSEHNNLFDFELGFDLFYFTFIWKQKDKVLKGKDLKIITDHFGQRIDLLNLQWLLRAKKYYHMSTASLYAMIIPCYYHLKPRDISLLVEAPGYSELLSCIQKTYYGRLFQEQISDIREVESSYIHLLEYIYRMSGQKNPYSAAIINHYLYAKEHEIHRITSMLEGIRYQLPSQEILAYAENQTRGGYQK